MSVRDAPRGSHHAAAFRASGPPPTGARLAAVLAAGERHADATAAPGDGARNWRKLGRAAMMAKNDNKGGSGGGSGGAPSLSQAKIDEETARITGRRRNSEPAPAPAAKPKSWLGAMVDDVGAKVQKGASEMGAKAQANAKAYTDRKKEEIKDWNKWREDDAKALKDLRKKTARAAEVRQEEGNLEQKAAAYEPLAKLAMEAYGKYRKTYWEKTREGRQHADVPITDDVLKALYEKYEREVAYNDTRSKFTDPRGAPETISCGFDDDDALLAAEMEAAGTALCCEEGEGDETSGVMSMVKGLRLKSNEDKTAHANIMATLKDARAQYKAKGHGNEFKDGAIDKAVTALGQYRRLHGLKAAKDDDDARARAIKYLSSMTGWISESFEPGIDQEEIGCGWDAMRGMQYPCGMVFAMVGADGVTRLYCASGRPPTDYDNSRGLEPLSHVSAELRKMLEDIAGMWPSAPPYSRYVLVPQGQSEPAPAPAPEPSTTTEVRIPISDLEAPGGAAKLTQYVMDWLKKLNVKINEDDKTNTELNGVAAGRAAAAPYNLGKGGFKATVNAQRVARNYRDKLRQLAAAKKAQRLGVAQAAAAEAKRRRGVQGGLD